MTVDSETQAPPLSQSEVYHLVGNVRQKRQEIEMRLALARDEIDEAMAELAEVQDMCPHPSTHLWEQGIVCIDCGKDDLPS